MKLQKSFDEGKSPKENEVSNWDGQLLFWIGICSSKDLTQFTTIYMKNVRRSIEIPFTLT